MAVAKKEKSHYNKNHDLRCQTKSISRMLKEMSEEKKNIVEEMKFGALAHILEMNISHKLLRELIHCYDAYHGCLNTLYGKIYITLTKIRDALRINLGGEENWLKFRRTFVIFVQKYFLLPTIGIKAQREGKKLFVDGCMKRSSLDQKQMTLPGHHKWPIGHGGSCSNGLLWKQVMKCYPPEPEHQACEEFSVRQMEQEHPLNVLGNGISPPTSQPTLPTSQPTVTQLEMLVEVVMDAGVTAALQYAKEMSAEPSLSTHEGFKTPVKEKEITEELREKCYHLMTQLKVYKDTTNEYDTIFLLDHEAYLEWARFHFMWSMQCVCFSTTENIADLRKK
ncbi:hypothetical protein AHAS_Ahas03G0254800 [Arachis hypogaea]